MGLGLVRASSGNGSPCHAASRRATQPLRWRARTEIATRIVESWIGERGYEIVSVEVDDTTARVALSGAEFPEDAAALGEDLHNGLDGDPVDVDLRVTLQERTLIEADAD